MDGFGSDGIQNFWPVPVPEFIDPADLEKIISNPDPGSSGPEMNLKENKLIKFTVSQQMQTIFKNPILLATKLIVISEIKVRG